jgi:adenylate cyclase
MGKIRKAYGHMERVYELYDPEQQHSHLLRYGQDPRVLALMFTALTSWILGHVDEAIEKQREMLKLAEALSHPFSMAIALQAAAWLDQHLKDVESTRKHAEMLIELTTEYHFPFYLGFGTMLRGWAVAMQGLAAQGIVQIQEGFNRWLGGRLVHSFYSLLLAEAYAQSGEIKNGLRVLDKGLEVASEHTELCYEAELYRLKAEMLLTQSEVNRAESEFAFRKAIDIARRQGAKSFELRAAVGLGRLLRQQGQSKEAGDVISEIYNWFPEGFTSADLQEARALLEEHETFA